LRIWAAATCFCSLSARDVQDTLYFAVSRHAIKITSAIRTASFRFIRAQEIWCSCSSERGASHEHR
jgi:hypothetical protein